MFANSASTHSSPAAQAVVSPCHAVHYVYYIWAPRSILRCLAMQRMKASAGNQSHFPSGSLGVKHADMAATPNTWCSGSSKSTSNNIFIYWNVSIMYCIYGADKTPSVRWAPVRVVASIWTAPYPMTYPTIRSFNHELNSDIKESV